MRDLNKVYGEAFIALRNSNIGTQEQETLRQSLYSMLRTELSKLPDAQLEELAASKKVCALYAGIELENRYR